GPRLRERVQVDGSIAPAKSVSRYPPVERRQAGFVHFAPLSFEGIQFGPKSKLRRTQIFCVAPYTLLDVVTAEPKRAGFRLTAEGNVDVRVAGIEVRDCNPLQTSAQIPFHPGEQFSGMPSQVEPFAEFRRHDQLKEPLVAGGLPGVQHAGRIYCVRT